MDLTKYKNASLEQRLAESEARVRELQEVCAEGYQLAGAYNASVEALDNLSAAAAGKPLPHKTFLPVINISESERVKKLESDYNAVRDYADKLIAVGWRYRKALERIKNECEEADESSLLAVNNIITLCMVLSEEALAEAPSAQCQADRWKHSVGELGARIKAAEGKCSCPDFPGWCPVHLFNSADWGPIVADSAPSEGKPSEGKDGA